MTDAIQYGGRSEAVDTATLFGATMFLVAATTGFFALGAYLGRDLPYEMGWVWFIVAFACLFGLQLAVRRSMGAATVLLLVFGLLIGLAVAPTVAYYARTNPQVVWQAGGATALFMVGFGAAGWVARRDLSGVARIALVALIALIIFGIVAIFVQIPHSDLIYAVAGLVIFAALTAFDFQRLR